MLRHYLKIAWRNIIKDPQFTFLNLIGLATGMACTLLIYLWVNDELSVDKFHQKDSRLFQVMQNKNNDKGIETIEYTPGLLAKSLAEEMPEVEYATSVIPPSWFPDKGILSFKDNKIKADGQFVEKDYFKMFDCPIAHGRKNSVLPDKYSVAISDELALKLFNTTDNVVGKTIEWKQKDYRGQYVVSAIFKKPPANSSTQFDLLFNYELFLEKRPQSKSWGNGDPFTYLLLKKGTDVNQFNAKISNYIKSKDDKLSPRTLFTRRYSDKYLYGKYENGVQAGGRIAYVKLFSIIAILILVIACINFMNLATAKVSGRLKEIGIKKVVGASRVMLILQYLGESMLMTFLSLVVAIILTVILLPSFNEITGKQLNLQFDRNVILSILSITFFTGLISGSYPAFYLSGFNPMNMLKGKLSTSIGESLVRKGVVVFQFTVSVILIVSVLIIYEQIQYIQSKNLGYNRNNVIYFEKGGKAAEDYKEGESYEQDLQNFLARVKNVPGVLAASNFRHTITNREGGTTDVNWEGKSKDNQTSFTDIPCGYDFIETLGIEMKDGQSFSKDLGSKNPIIFNEAAIENMGIKNPIGKIVKVWGEDKQIIGIAKNFHFESLYENLKPCFFDFSLSPRLSKIMVKIKPGTEKETLARLQQLYKEVNPGLPFEYKFLDDEYKNLYASEQRVAQLAWYFAALAIIISCLGLFGLAAFTAQKRRKEIGIRKVMGATGARLAVLLSKDFITLVIIAGAIAFPIAWWSMNQWLTDFAYRINIQWWMFAVAGLLAIVIALVTISFQAIKAAIANPVKSLKTE
ncbi:MAG TPA: ABC transporter permease [Segetibacter sp.]